MKNKIMDIIYESNEIDSVVDLRSGSNYVSNDVLKALGSRLANGGFENDKLDTISINSAKVLFDVKYVNIKPNSLSSAINTVFKTLLKKNDKILIIGIESEEVVINNMLFDDYNYTLYKIPKETGQINYDDIRKLVEKEKPNLIYVTTESYVRKIDFAELKDVATLYKTCLFSNIGDIAGLVVSGLYQNPCKCCDVVVSSTNNTLRGPAGAVILSNSESIIKLINKKIDEPNTLNIEAARTISFIEAKEQSFIDYQKQVLKNAKILCDVLKIEGSKVITNGTDNHMVILDVKKSYNITGKEAKAILKNIGVMCDMVLIPEDVTTPFITSGIKLSVSKMTTLGFNEKDFLEVGKIMSTCLNNSENNTIIDDLLIRIKVLCYNVFARKEGD